MKPFFYALGRPLGLLALLCCVHPLKAQLLSAAQGALGEISSLPSQQFSMLGNPVTKAESSGLHASFTMEKRYAVWNSQQLTALWPSSVGVWGAGFFWDQEDELKRRRISMAFHKKLQPSFSAGLRWNTQLSYYEEEKKTHHDISLGITHQLKEELLFAATISPSIAERQVENMQLGLSYQLSSKLLLLSELEKRREQALIFKTAFSYELYAALSCQLGWNSQHASFGLSYSPTHWKVGIAFLHHQYLGYVSKLTLGYSL